MPDTSVGLSERLLREGEKVRTFFRALSEEQFECSVYSEGADWTVREVLAHLVATEKAFSSLIENVMAGGSGAPEGFDLDTFNQRKVAALKDSSIDELLENFHRLRDQTASIVSTFNEGELNKNARHPFLGVVPLVDIVKLIYRHNQIHLRDVRRVIG
jgi:uncharacterized damage-inducible protein DinB